MSVQGIVDGGEEGIVAQSATEHVQDQPALLIQVTIKEIDRLIVVTTHDGALVRALGFTQVDVEVHRDVMFVLIVAQASFALNVLEIGRKALVEPGVGPIAACNQITKPMMS